MLKSNFILSYIFVALLFFGTSQISLGQEDLLSLIETEPTQDFVKAGFKTTRIINNHSFEMNSKGVLDFKISHRFGTLNGGAYELFGLDNASIRIGLDYGITDWLNIGFGRSSFEKFYDGFVKVKFLRQQTGLKNIPLSVLYMSNLGIKGLRNLNPALEPYYFSNRMYYTHQLIVGRKFSEGFSLQLMPTLVHRNLVATVQEGNDVFLLGIGSRIKLTKRVAFNVEYHYAFPNQLANNFTNSLSVGFDIETGGHVFQLHFTNSTSMADPVFLTETQGQWGQGDIHFGFNISRVFTVYRPKK